MFHPVRQQNIVKNGMPLDGLNSELQNKLSLFWVNQKYCNAGAANYRILYKITHIHEYNRHDYFTDPVWEQSVVVCVYIIRTITYMSLHYLL